MKNKKKFGFLLIALIIFISLGTITYAQSDLESAEALKELGLFKGTDNGFELEREPNRLETAVMMVRLLGIEQEVLNGSYEHPFNDVPDWADKYIGYLYENNITKGISSDTFGSKNLATEKDYITFVLRALGYSDAKGDFSWNNSMEFAESLGLTSRGDTTFTRGSMVDISYRALNINIKDSQVRLLDKISTNIEDKEISEENKTEKNDYYFYYINETSDSKFYQGDEDSYKIFRMKDGNIEKISQNSAYDITIINDTIYFMDLSYLEREWGFVQRGKLWQIQTDGTNEKQVSEQTIFSLTSDEKYVYFSTEDAYGYNIMRMEPSKDPEIFKENVRSFNLYSSGEWLYYVDNNDGDIIKRINTNTMVEETVTNNPTEYEFGFMFIVYENYLIMHTYDSDWNYYILKLNMDTGEESTIDVEGSLIGIDANGLLYFYMWDTDEIKFIQVE